MASTAMTFPPSLIAACALSCLLVPAAPASSSFNAEDAWAQSVRAENLNTVVFVSVKTHTANGLEGRFTGTGFIVSPDGYVITCDHVIPKASDYKTIEVTGAVGGRYEYSYPLDIIRRDEQGDLVLLKLPQGASPWHSVRATAQEQVGASIIALGFPLNENLVSVPGSITGNDAKKGRWLTNASFNPGMSGGPIFNRVGALVAIVSGGYEGSQPLNLIIPVSLAKGLLESVNSPALANVPSIGLPSAAPQKVVHEVTTESFRFKLRGCTLSGSIVNCTLSVTNLAGDREFQIDSGRIKDGDNNEYLARRFSLGAESRALYIHSTLPAGEERNAGLKFESVRPDTQLLTLLELKGHTLGSAGNKVVVRLTEIPLGSE